MLRSLLIYLSKAAWARRLITRWDFAWRTASRFVAGEKLEDAIAVVRALNASNITATLDHLGENTTNTAEAKRTTEDILSVFDAIEQAGVKSNVSVKLTQIGLAVDRDLCADNLKRILNYAHQKNNFVRIDMEDSPWVDATLELYYQMRLAGMDNTGVVIQAYLYRSEKDLTQIIRQGGRVRLCKGAYKEPGEVAYPGKADVDKNYDVLAAMLIDGACFNQSPVVSKDGRVPPIPAIASHDPARIQAAKAYAQQAGLPKEALEFQMLYGIRRDLQVQLASQGYPVRVYVPFGSEWYPYFTRRLAERPANVWFFISNFIRI
jgi:proline dehydrogenase